MDVLQYIGSQRFNVPEAFCVMNVNQTTKHRKKNHFCSFNTDLSDFIYTMKTVQRYFTFDDSISVPEYC